MNYLQGLRQRREETSSLPQSNLGSSSHSLSISNASGIEGTPASGRSTPVQDDEPFGLEVLQELGDGETPIQIIFLHGLGGSKKGTWTHQRTGECWPFWLRNEEGFEGVRLALYGYDANINVAAPNTNLNVRLFANQLLFDIGQLHYRTRPVIQVYNLN